MKKKAMESCIQVMLCPPVTSTVACLNENITVGWQSFAARKPIWLEMVHFGSLLGRVNKLYKVKTVIILLCYLVM